MYATVRSYPGAVGLADALAKRDDDVRSAITSIAGFRSYHLVRTDRGAVVTVSVFDDRAGADESVRAAAEWIRTNVPEFTANPPQVSSGEVLFSF